MPIPFTPVPPREPTVIRTPPRMTIRQLEIAMRWWKGLPYKAQEMYRLEHPESFKAADRITLFFIQNFPKCLAAEELRLQQDDELEAAERARQREALRQDVGRPLSEDFQLAPRAETHPTEPSADEIWNSSNGQGD